MIEIECLVYAESPASAADMAERLETIDGVASAAQTTELSEVARRSTEGNLDALLLQLGDDPAPVFRAVEALPSPRPTLVFLGPAEQSAWILEAMRLGAREYISPHVDPAALEALIERIGKTVHADPRRGSTAPIVGVVGAKGGVGATMLACQLAATLQRRGEGNTCLVDLDLRQGDVAVHFDLPVRYSMADVARTRKRIDASFIDSLVTVHPSGLSLVCAPTQPEDGELITPEHVAKALRLLRARFDCIVLDLPSPWDEAGLQALDMVDTLLLVTTPELTALTQARKQLDLLQRIGVSAENVFLVANRVGCREGIRNKDASDYLGRPFDFKLPNDYLAVSSCVNTGGALDDVARGSGLAEAMHGISLHLIELLEIEAAQTRPGSGSGNRLGAAFENLMARAGRFVRPSREASGAGAKLQPLKDRAAVAKSETAGAAVSTESTPVLGENDQAGANGSLRSH